MPPPTLEEVRNATAARRPPTLEAVQAAGAPPPVPAGVAALRRVEPLFQSVEGTIPPGREAAAQRQSQIRAARGLPPAFFSESPEAQEGSREIAEQSMLLLASAGTGGLGIPARIAAMAATGGIASLATERPGATGSPLRRAAVRAGAAGAASLVGAGAGAGLARLARSATRFAENQGAKALGFIQSSLRQSGRDEARRVARVALDERVISPLASAETMIARAEVIKRTTGRLLGEIRKEVDGLSPGADVGEVLQRVARRLQPRVRGLSDQPAVLANLRQALQDIQAHADPSGRLNASGLLGAKRVLADRVFQNSLQTPETLAGGLASRSELARGVVQRAEERLVRDVLPQRFRQFKGAKNRFGAVERLTNRRSGVTEARANRDLGNNQVFGFTPAVVGSGFAGSGGGRAIGAGALARFGSLKGNQISSVVGNRIAQLAGSPIVPTTTRGALQLIARQLSDEEARRGGR